MFRRNFHLGKLSCIQKYLTLLKISGGEKFKTDFVSNEECLI